MTGFARESAETGAGTLSWEIRAVNHRYLDLQFKLPDSLRPHEAAFRKQASAVLGRGKVECALYHRRAIDPALEMQLDETLLDLLADRLHHVARKVPGAGAVDALDVLRWPGLVRQAEVDAAPLLDAATGLLGKALDAIAAMRRSEGERIETMLESRCADIAALAASVRERMPEVLAAIRDRQRERIDKLEVDADPARLEVELSLVAQKLDVAEELDRLDSHLVEVRAALGKGEPVGRRLDFLMQELNREANTLASKSADAGTTRAAVDLKVLIEQMREQVQNVE